MSFHKKVDNFVEEVCKDLKQDLEIYQKQAGSVREQLWQIYETNIKDGKTEDESCNETFKEIGSPQSIHQKINNDNFPVLRKKLKSKLLIFTILIPFSILFTISFLVPNLIELYYLRQVNSGKRITKIESPYKLHFKSTEAAVLAILEKTRNSDLSFDDYEKLIQIDPENGYFDLLYFSNLKKLYYNTDYQIIDQNLYEDKLHLIKNFLKKKHYNSFHSSIYKKLNDTIPHSHFLTNAGLIETINRRFMHVPAIRRFIKVNLVNIEKLNKANNKLEAINSLKFLMRIKEKQFKHSSSLLEVLLITRVSEEVLENNHARELIEEESLLKSIKLKLKIFSKQRSKNEIEKVRPLIFNKGAYNSILLSSICKYMKSNIKKHEFTPTRHMEYLAFERYNLSVAFLVLTTIFIILYILCLSNYKKISISYISPYFSIKSWVKTISLYVILPLLIYQFYRMTPFAAYNTSFHKSGLVIYLELIILFLVVFSLSTWKVLRASYSKIIPTEAKMKDKGKLRIIEYLIYLFFGGISLLYIYSPPYNMHFNSEVLSKHFWNQTALPLFFAKSDADYRLYIFLLICLFPFYVRFAFFFSNLRFLKFKAVPGAMQNLLIHWSILLITVTIYCSFYIRFLEAKNYDNDTLLKISRGTSSMAAEHKVIEEAKKLYRDKLTENNLE